MGQPAYQRICIVRTRSGRDYHFPLSGPDDRLRFRLLNQGDNVCLVRGDGREKMVFTRAEIEVVRYEEGALPATVSRWQDPIV